MKYMKAYIETWGLESVIIPAQCLGHFTGCLPGCPVKNCRYAVVI